MYMYIHIYIYMYIKILLRFAIGAWASVRRWFSLFVSYVIDTLRRGRGEAGGRRPAAQRQP